MNRNITFFLLLLMLGGCTKPVELNLEDFIQQPVLNCFFTPNDPFVVHLSQTTSMFDTLVLDVDNAIVEIYNEDKLIASLPNIGSGYYSDSTIYPDLGVFYTIKAKIDGYEPLSASDSIPSNFSDFKYIRHKANAWYEDETNYDAFVFEIDDRPGYNYYEAHYRVKYTHYNTIQDTSISYSRINTLFCFDPLVKEPTTKNLFTDRYFNNSKYTIELMNQNIDFYLNRDSLELQLQVIEGSYHYFKYMVVYDQHRMAQYSDFFNPTEPVTMYSNIENGYGIFAGFDTRFYPFKVIRNAE